LRDTFPSRCCPKGAAALAARPSVQDTTSRMMERRRTCGPCCSCRQLLQAVGVSLVSLQVLSEFTDNSCDAGSEPWIGGSRRTKDEGEGSSPTLLRTSKHPKHGVREGPVLPLQEGSKNGLPQSFPYGRGILETRSGFMLLPVASPWCM